ncbi:MAG: hypothetical protein JWR26_2297 [Pedosphaera sp.]|nr:hypothetical protein [Pedosphaera sp.]
MNTLKCLFLDELTDIYDAEHRIMRALPKLIKAATCNHLKSALQANLEETEGHVKTLDRVFESFRVKPKRKTCDATMGLLQEAAEIASEFKGSPAINAALICAAQKVEHYEIAAYGCLHEWARLLENRTAASLLQEILAEEESANDSLTELARSRSNPEALGKPEQNGNNRAMTDGRPTNLRRGVQPLSPRQSRASAAAR